MSAKLYEECTTCNGTGNIVSAYSDSLPCGCKRMRVVETGLTSGQAESLARELKRRDLRIAGLTKEAAEAGQEVIRLRSALLTHGASVVDAVSWWRNASPLDQVIFTKATGLRLGDGVTYVHGTDRTPPPLHASEEG